MKILVFSHKECWKSDASPTGWATDGGFVFHMQAIASLANELEVICFESTPKPTGEVLFRDRKISLFGFQLKPYNGIRRKLWVLYLAVTRLRFFIRKIREADLVHTPIPSDLSTIGMILTRWMKKPLFVRHCGDWLSPGTKAEFFWRNFMEKHTGKHMVGLTTGGNYAAPSTKNKNIRWIFSSSLLDTEITTLSEQRDESIESGTIRLITVSRQTVNKGAGRTLEALNLLKEKGYDIHFTIIGRGEYLDELKSRAMALGLEGSVSFMGQLSNVDVMKALQSSHIFVFPSTASEGFPKAVLEALASGLPVVTSRVAVLPQLVEETRSGFALTDLGPESLSNAIERIITNQELYRNFSVNAAKTARQYSLEKWVDFIADAVNEQFNWKLTRKTEIIK